jgi:DNA invertase Pin-like site-specific DNA recombinase
MSTDTKRAAIYCRVSSDEQVLGTSLDDQEQRGQLAASNRGCVVVGIFRDEGVTGTTSNRPEWRRLMAACRRGEVDLVIASRWDRLARKAMIGLQIAAELEELSVGLLVLESDLDTSTPQGQMMRHMLLGFAALDRDMLVERMARGQHAMAAKGLWPSGGSSPYGYRATGGRTNTLVLHEPEACVVREVVGWIVNDGLTTGQVARRLNARGTLTRTGRPWSHQNLRRQLLQRVLVGEVIWANTEKTHRSYVPTGKYGPPVKLQFEPIISESQYAALQQVLSVRSRGGRRENRAYPLAGRLHCPCGDHYTGAYREDRDLRQYRCRASLWTVVERSRCYAHRLDADWVEAETWRAITALLSDPEKLIALAQDYLGLRGPQIRVERDEVAATEARITRLETALVSAVKDGLISDVSASAKLVAELEQDLKDAKQVHADLLQWQKESATESRRVRGLWELADSAAPRLASMTAMERAEVIALLDVQVNVMDNPDAIQQPRNDKRGRGEKRPALHIEGSLPHHKLLDVMRPGNSEVAGTPPVSLRRRGSARVASAALP